MLAESSGRIMRKNPDVVVFGHTHKRFCERSLRPLLNPGYRPPAVAGSSVPSDVWRGHHPITWNSEDRELVVCSDVPIPAL
jgi:hypothetical protein